MVKDCWDQWIGGAALFVFSQKLKNLKAAVKMWAKENYPNINLEIEEARMVLEDVQQEAELNGMDDLIFAREADAKTRFLEGAKNQKYHSVLKNGDGILIIGKDHLEEYVSDYYESFHKHSSTLDHLEMLDCVVEVLTDHDRWKLDMMPSNVEIKVTVWDLNLESTPGLDGFPGMFYRVCWDIISADVCNAVQNFFSESFMPPGLNSNFIVLIPKIEGAISLDKFRPLCLGNFFCKIISKILAIRLSTLLPRLILEDQGAFQKGKIIHSNIILASELTNMMFFVTRGGGMA
ncbi:uncharacterized protein LOC122071118 [Macadamia integrifolia]|uniref:uncharacterized protein LOC122071118 n=1 Tax=Macadamia integrifolia TaxID=60698 RepID=UPI001C4FFE72|nr:uncharacterized protein LOC122071118 [Macadamia integrifolia]